MPVLRSKTSDKNFSVLETGAVTTLQGVTEVEFRIADLTFNFVFSDKQVAKPDVNFRITEGALTLVFEGFKGTLPTTFQGSVGTVSGKKLWLVASVGTSGEPPAEHRLISYGFYVEEPN